MKIVFIGDLFVRSTIFQEAWEQQLGPLLGNVTLLMREVNWPDVPVTHNDEIKEFVGDPGEIAELVRDSQVIVTHVAPISKAAISAAPDLQIIACCRGGPVNINVPAATARKIPVVNSPGRNSQAVVEFTLGLIIAECRGISRAHGALSQGVWQGELYRYDKAGRELKGQTIGLVGFGIIARMLVPYLKTFGMRILAYDPYVPAAQFARQGVEQTDLSTLLQASDIVSVHARLTSETQGMIGAREFTRMKPGAYFINTARGPLVDYEALCAALQSGHLGGAGLDTLALEPPPADWPLLKLDNVTLTPHIAGSSRESAQRGVQTVLGDIANFYAGKPLRNRVNPPGPPTNAVR
ncbi:MAG: 2-hydroxyacid dehydrogenase [Desulfobacterales bacterium]|nr:MAG: 2-hydroxyacid dehydrogenase [Desulfobacterales bacterium]